MIELDVQLLSLLLGSGIPLLVALTAKLGASSEIKSVMNLILSVMAGGLAWAIENSGAFTWQEALTAAVSAYLASGVAYQNLWKPTKIAEKVSVKTPNLGLGSNDALLQYATALKTRENLTREDE